MSFGKTVSVRVSDVKFDPEDDYTENLNKNTCWYYVYFNNELNGKCSAQNDYKEVAVNLSSKFLNDDTNVIRIIARDHGLTTENGDFQQIGCISLSVKYFREYPDNARSPFSQWITLFDDPEDDEFDGELAEDDEELPQIKVQWSISKSSVSAATSS